MMLSYFSLPTTWQQSPFSIRNIHIRKAFQSDSMSLTTSDAWLFVPSRDPCGWHSHDYARYRWVVSWQTSSGVMVGEINSFLLPLHLSAVERQGDTLVQWVHTNRFGGSGVWLTPNDWFTLGHISK